MGFVPINTGGRMYAAIRVTYKAGETCTCTNGTRTLTAKNTSGVWLFAVPSAGTWTVKAGSKTKDVSITAESQYASANLDESRLIIDGSGYAEGYSLTAVSGSASVNSAGVVELKGASGVAAYFYFDELDVTNYTVMKVKVKGYTVCSYGIGNDSSLSASVKGEKNNTEAETLSLDLSNIEGKYRPAVHVSLYTNEVVASIYEWWFE